MCEVKGIFCMNNVSLNMPRHNISFGSQNKTEKKTPPNPTISGVPLRGTKRLNMHPLVIGGINGFCWLSAGIITDRLISKIFKTKAGSVPARILQGALALATGYNAYRVAKNEVSKA